METLPTHLKIRFRGKLHGDKWIYQTPKVVELPIPYLSRSEKIGEVICDPIGVFPYEFGKVLLDQCGENGAFVLEEKIFAPQAKAEREIIPGANPIIPNPNPLGVLQPLSAETIRKRTNYARLKRGVRKRKERSDKGISRPFGAKKPAAIPDNPQAAAEVQLAPSPA